MAKRKIIQISTIQAKEGATHSVMVALADDGTIWHARFSTVTGELAPNLWVQVDTPPGT
jgi:hypothetical protein